MKRITCWLAWSLLAFIVISLLPVLTFLTPREDEDRALADIAQGMAAGTLTHHVGPRFALDEIVAANTAFALDLYRELQEHDGNVFFSPLSISTASPSVRKTE